MKISAVLLLLSFLGVRAETPAELKKELIVLKRRIGQFYGSVEKVEISDKGKAEATLPIGQIEITFSNGVKQTLTVPLDLTSKTELKTAWVEVTFQRFLRNQLFPKSQLSDGRTYSFNQALNALLEYVRNEGLLLKEFSQRSNAHSAQGRAAAPLPYYFVELTDRWKNQAVELMKGKFGPEYFVTDPSFWDFWQVPKESVYKDKVTGRQMHLPEVKLLTMIRYYEGLERDLSDQISQMNKELSGAEKLSDKLLILDGDSFHETEGLLELEARKARVTQILRLLQSYAKVVLTVDYGVKSFLSQAALFYPSLRAHFGAFDYNSSWDIFFKRQKTVQALEGKVIALISLKEAMESGKAIDWQKTWSSVVKDLETLGPEGHIVTPMLVLQEMIDMISKFSQTTSAKNVSEIISDQSSLLDLLNQSSAMRVRILNYMETVTIELRNAERALEAAQKINAEKDIKLQESHVFRLSSEMRILKAQLESVNAFTLKLKVR